MFVGKWKYCSPEHLGLLREGERIDGRADLYSFGIVLYEMLTGVPPFQADTPHAYLMMHSSEMPKSLRDTNPTVKASPALEALIFRALHKDRDTRFKSAREFAQELEKLIPRLEDTPGAPALPVAAEVTAEPTRVRRRDDEPVEKLEPIEVDSGATTVQTLGGAEASATPAGEARRPRRIFPLAAALALVVAITIAGATMLRNRAESVAAPVAPRPVQASVIAVAPGHLGINAYPWATVTSIRNLENGRSVMLKGPLITPAPIDLAPGRYEVTLSNPDFPQPIVKTIEVKAGQEQMLHVPFADASSITLPKLAGTPQ
jgi:hypothetical protein